MVEEAHRKVARRDGRLEGEPHNEPAGGSRMKETQRDLTSLSTPVKDEAHDEESQS